MKSGDRVAVTGYFMSNYPTDVVEAVNQGTSFFSHMTPYEDSIAAIRVPGKGLMYMPLAEAENMHEAAKGDVKSRLANPLLITIKKAVFDLDSADLDPTLGWSDYAAIVRSVANDLRKHIND